MQIILTVHPYIEFLPQYLLSMLLLSPTIWRYDKSLLAIILHSIHFKITKCLNKKKIFHIDINLEYANFPEYTLYCSTTNWKYCNFDYQIFGYIFSRIWNIDHRLPIDWTSFSKETYTILQCTKHINGKPILTEGCLVSIDNL